MRRMPFLWSWALVIVPALAAQQAPQRCDGPEFRQFDYWVGDWEVTDSAGTTLYGTNLVTLEEQGCVVHEHWTGRGGSTGQSFNYWDRNRKVWQQDWVASGGTNMHLVGGLRGDTMTLEAEVPGPGGTTLHHVIQWIPQPDGRVRQFWRTSRDGGRTWTTGFDGYYRKKR